MFYNKTVEETLEAIKTNGVSGLTSEEAASRLEKNGYNQLEGKKEKINN